MNAASDDVIDAIVAVLGEYLGLGELATLSGRLANRVAQLTPIPERAKVGVHECWIRSDNSPSYCDQKLRKGGVFCVYGRSQDSCVFCGQPHERK